ncbi:MAG: class II fructose-bisphosphate aldolase [Patescibacteria group bacterium]|nr:class II fructose-bisphosphate aldolase [Patescibacteria group bacterium]MBU1877084.1 class II fructose-bisphosphate aldolase [Patescibacteria group bacterium]
MELIDYFKKAQKENWAIGQFNFTTDEQLKGIIDAAKKLNSPIILGTSEGESQFLGLKKIKVLVDAFRDESDIPIFLNLDHGKNLDYIREAIKIGYNCVHFDGSDLCLEDNIKKTKNIVKLAFKKGVLVEGEVGIIGGKLTDPKEAKEFVQKTRVDILAVNIGTVHGGKAKIDFKRLAEIKKAVNDTPLVLHGGSGVNSTDIKKAIELGIVKININTELRLAWRKNMEEILKKDKNEIKPYKILTPLSEQIKKVVENKIKLFGSENKA